MKVNNVMAELLGNYPFEFVESDTYEGFSIRLTVVEGSVSEPIDLTGSTIQMRIKSVDRTRVKHIDLTTYNRRIIIDDATEGKFSVIKQKIKLPAGLYDYSIQVKFSNGDQKTYLVGECRVLANSTSKSY